MHHHRLVRSGHLSHKIPAAMGHEIPTLLTRFIAGRDKAQRRVAGGSNLPAG